MTETADCQCPICGRLHRHLGSPPPSVMEQIARDMREGTFPKKSNATLCEESSATSRPDTLREAFIAGATAVHNEWVAASEREEGPPRSEPDFSEAASDYATRNQGQGGGPRS